MRVKKAAAATLLLALLALCACSSGGGQEEQAGQTAWDGLEYESSMELSYATQFSVDYYQGGYALITIGDSQRFLVVPEDGETPSGLPDDVVALQQPVEQIYLVSTSVMDYFRQLDGIDRVTLCSLEAEDWYIREAVEAMQAGEMQYAGKYSAPDYELIVSQGCQLAIENTMIYHSPEVKEKLEELGIPVLVEYSSYESDPLGRMEWIKLYAVLLGCQEQAESYFAQVEEQVTQVLSQEGTDKTVAFFYITTTGAVSVRKSGDYVAKCIDMAGGLYISFDDEEEENALSTMTVQMESFYALARDADCLIYNSTIDGEISTLSDLLGKSSLLSDFAAVQQGNVWCVEKSLYQEPLSLGDLIVDIHKVLTQEDPEDLTFLFRVTDE